MNDLSLQQEPIELLASDFTSRIREGKRPVITEYVEDYPEYSAKIQTLFPIVALMEQLRIHTQQRNS